MKEYIPNNWVIVEITTPEQTYYKVLAGWAGGFAYGESWQINSGITKVEEKDNYYYFYGYSGSVYRCHQESEGLKTITAGIYNRLEEKFGDMVRIVKAKDLDRSKLLTSS